MKQQLITEAKRFQQLAGIITENVNGTPTKEDKIAVIKEWIWYTCNEGQAEDDINKYNKMVDTYFANKNDITKNDFSAIWSKVSEKWGVGDTGADSEGFEETWEDIQAGNSNSMKYDEIPGFEGTRDALNNLSIRKENQEIDLFGIINSNKNKLAKKFNLDIKSSMVSGGDEDEPVQILDDNGDQVDFIKKDNWESNKEFYNNNQEIGEIILDGVDVVYIINPY
jgi:hypothetical protein